MRRTATASSIARWAVFAVGLLVIGYLAAVALQPSILDALPGWLRWFGQPGSMATIAIVVAVFGAVCVLTLRSDGGHRLVGVSFTVIAVLITMTAVLGLSSYWRCHDTSHPAFFTPLMWTAQLLRAASAIPHWAGGTAPAPLRWAWKWHG